MDPALSGGDPLTLPSLAGAGGPDLGWAPTVESEVKTTSTIVAEGIPPIATKLLERIRKWEFIDLALLIGDPNRKVDEVPYLNEGKVVLFQLLEQAQPRKRQIVDIQLWTQAFTVFMAAMASASSTSKEEVVGLIAHSYLILQLSCDMGGLRWIKYDQEYREWAEAKGIRRWGDLNLTIYGRCLAIQAPMAPQPATSPPQPGKPKRGSEKRGKLSRGSKKDGTCYRWNFNGLCDRGDCLFSHVCYNCGESHQALTCPRGPKRSRSDGPGL